MTSEEGPGRLPEGYVAREPMPDDAEAIADLMNAVTVAEVGVPWTTADDVRRSAAAILAAHQR